jgi:hypothetical protein
MTMESIVIEFENIQHRARPVDRLFGTTGWAGTINGMPSLTLCYYGGATLVWFDSRWMQASFGSLRELHETLGIKS